ncbi:hypothetical protein N2152v2_006877 [Parachlorella kessleri]
MHLEGKAAEWFSNQDFKRWEDFEKALQERFGLDPAKVLIRLERCKQGAQESVRDFADSIRTLTRCSGNPGQDDSLLLHFFLKGLRTEARDFVLYRRPTTFAQAVAEAEYYEDEFLGELTKTGLTNDPPRMTAAQALSGAMSVEAGQPSLGSSQGLRRAPPVPSAPTRTAAPRNVPRSAIIPDYHVMTQLDHTLARISVSELLRHCPFRAQVGKLELSLDVPSWLQPERDNIYLVDPAKPEEGPKPTMSTGLEASRLPHLLSGILLGAQG